MKIKKVFLVMGPYRSGTSLVSRVLQQFGISAGPEQELYEATDWNPAGYIQRPDITRFNTSLIRQAGGDLTTPGHPEVIASSVGRNFFSSLDLSWMESYEAVLIKDPRLCFTFYAWQAHQVLSDCEIFVVRVSRNIEATALSALAHYDVKHYCGNNLETARQVIQAYDHFAAWHLDKLQLPAFHLKYESLLADPGRMIESLAAFLKIADASKIRSALRVTAEGRSKIDKYRIANDGDSFVID